ncbi:MAG: hypothetical protein R3F05_06940 [Planctomycetota bacterium]
MRTIRALLFLGGAAAAAALFAQEPAAAYGHGHGAFASPSSRSHARSYARRAYYRAPTTYTTYRTSYAQNNRYVQSTPRTVAATPEPTTHHYVDRNGNVWIERGYSAPARTAPVQTTRYVQPTYVAAATPSRSIRVDNPRVEYDEAGRPWIRRDSGYRTSTPSYATSSPAPAAGAGLGTAVRSLRNASAGVPAPRPVRVEYSAPRPTPGTYTSASSTCFT